MTIECSCKRFESYGLLCCHIFYVLRMAQVKDFPKKYLLKRWLKDVVPARVVGDKPVETSNRPEALQQIYKSVEATFNRLVNDEEKLKSYIDSITDLLAKAELEVPKAPKLSKNEVIGSLLGVKVSQEPVTIHVPKGIRNKGCGSHSRFKSKKELGVKKSQSKKRKCQLCMQSGHNSRSCDQNPKNKKKKMKKKFASQVELSPKSPLIR